MILVGTGHRPKYLGGYGKNISLLLEEICTLELKRLSPSLVISGGALGWDIALAKSAISLNIPLDMCIPCKDYDSRWPLESRLIYREVLNKANSITYMGNIYHISLLDKRNRYMIDKADIVLALFNGEERGGTYNAIRYAQLKGKEVINVWNMFDSMIH